MASLLEMKTYNPQGRRRVLVTKPLVGRRWLDILIAADCRVDQILYRGMLTEDQIINAIGSRCDGVVGQLTENWDEKLFSALKRAGGKVYTNVAVGFDNVKVEAATDQGIAVGNTPGVLTEATAEMAVSLILSTARRVVEADKFMRADKYDIWLPDLFIGKLLHGKTIGIIGAGRIGSSVALTMVRGFNMNLTYFDKYQNKRMENAVEKYSTYLASCGEQPIRRLIRAGSVDEVLRTADIVSLHPNLDKTTFHLMNSERLQMMKKDAILINCARGPVIDEVALVQHCRENKEFYAGLDVFEDEPKMKPGLKDLDNVIVVPHIASATMWTRTGMCALAAANVASILQGYPVWTSPNVIPFVDDPVASMPKAAPSIVNAKALGLASHANPKL
mmetsp:Transcript_9019/g.18209  ORF Transcript_9019/g.18209 Transcript_9019/m.18209 type:complete len:390 (-) Transcript_9019:1975-3144(-)